MGHAGDLKDAAVIEIGPGPGSLTRSILAAGAPLVIAVEKDMRFAPSLSVLHSHYYSLSLSLEAVQMLEDASQGRLIVAQGDILKVTPESLLETINKCFTQCTVHPNDKRKQTNRGLHSVGRPPSKLHLIGNLPFNVATPLYIGWMHAITRRDGLFAKGLPPVQMTLMFQKEVAQRIVAGPNTEHRGRLSALSQRTCRSKIVMELKGKTFVPPPKVDAAVVSVEPLEAPLPVSDPVIFEDVLRYCYHMRRKALRHTLATVGPKYVEALGASGIDPLARPQSLTTAEWCKLSDQLQALGWTPTSAYVPKRDRDEPRGRKV